MDNESKKVISAAHTWFPPKDKLLAKLDRIYNNGVLTNNGPLLRELEGKLKEYLGVKHLVIVSNGTVAIMLALKALDVRQKVLCSSFSFVASSHSITWNGCTPVFADIKPDTYCLDPFSVEAVLEKEEGISAILGTHLFGNACDVLSIEKIAEKHGIPVIYDAAHSFGVKHNGRSLLSFGNASAISFQAYKPFTMVEGGAVVTDSDEVAAILHNLRYFGIDDNGKNIDTGFNAKTSELHAAVGLCSLEVQDEGITKRSLLAKQYFDELSGLPLQWMKPEAQTEMNYSYFPVLFPSKEKVAEVQQSLYTCGIIAKRYFYPALNTLDNFYSYVPMPYAENIAERILCLPMYFDLTADEVGQVCALVRSHF